MQKNLLELFIQVTGLKSVCKVGTMFVRSFVRLCEADGDAKRVHTQLAGDARTIPNLVFFGL
jgi:hypothetical protein